MTMLWLLLLGLCLATHICADDLEAVNGPRTHNGVHNVAVHGVASQSSTVSSWFPQHAIDGILSGNYLYNECAQTRKEDSPWWRVDLKGSHQVLAVAITNIAIVGKENINGAEILIGDSEEHGGTSNPRCANITSLDYGETRWFNCSGMKGRYVTVHLPGKNQELFLCEVQIFGLQTESEGDAFPSAPLGLTEPMDGVPNVALQGRSSQSSTPDKARDSEAAIDGSLLPRARQGRCSQTGEDLHPWWAVDLKSSFNVFAVAITSDSGLLEGAEIQIGNSAESGGTKNPRCAILSDMDHSHTVVYRCAGLEGRHVTITGPGWQQPLSLCEVQVFGLPVSRSFPNVALGGTASQSSIADELGEPGNAIDGSLASNYSLGSCSATEREHKPWWLVDLKFPFNVHLVALTNRGDCCRNTNYGAEIRIGNSDEEHGSRNPRCAVIPWMDYGTTKSFDCHGMEGRYVSVSLPRFIDSLMICEVQVFGLPWHSTTHFPAPLEVWAGSEGTGLAKKSLIFHRESLEDYVILKPERPLALTAFTLCMRVATEFEPRRESALFSYHTWEEDELNLWRERNGQFSLYLGGVKMGMPFTLPGLSPFRAHLCVTWESRSGLTAFWVDGVSSMRKVYQQGGRVRPDGVVMLGQDQDKYAGGFDLHQSFLGEISDLYMWSHVLSPEEIQRAHQGKEIPRGNIFDWKYITYRTEGAVIVA